MSRAVHAYPRARARRETRERARRERAGGGAASPLGAAAHATAVAPARRAGDGAAPPPPINATALAPARRSPADEAVARAAPPGRSPAASGPSPALAGLRPSKSPALAGAGLRGRSPGTGPQRSPAVLSSKKRQRTPPSAGSKKPELPWTDLVCVGKGTYGEVYRARPDDARRKTQGNVVALKKFIQRDDDWGFPITTLREHKILLKLRHANLIRLHEVFSPAPSYKSPVFMVFEYAELDLEIVIQSPVVRTIDEARTKSIVQQILEGVHYMHANQVMHRDLKPSNCLITRKGDVKICDFGLARSYKPGHAYTLPVVTLNYRPPELLLGCRHYGPPIDVWSVGAIFAELFKREIVVTGRDEGDYLQKLYALCGTPREVDWPEAKKVCKHWREACGLKCDKITTEPYAVAASQPRRRRILETFAEKGAAAAKLLDRLLAVSPTQRVTAKHALDDDFFWEGDPPLPAGNRSLPWDCDLVRASRDDTQRSQARARQRKAAAAKAKS